MQARYRLHGLGRAVRHHRVQAHGARGDDGDGSAGPHHHRAPADGDLRPRVLGAGDVRVRAVEYGDHVQGSTSAGGGRAEPARGRAAHLHLHDGGAGPRDQAAGQRATPGMHDAGGGADLPGGRGQITGEEEDGADLAAGHGTERSGIGADPPDLVAAGGVPRPGQRAAAAGQRGADGAHAATDGVDHAAAVPEPAPDHDLRRVPPEADV